jgi:hypothetical protein
MPYYHPDEGICEMVKEDVWSGVRVGCAVKPSCILPEPMVNTQIQEIPLGPLLAGMMIW